MNKQNARARAAGGFKVMDDIAKNKHADVYYRKAIESETEKMLSALFASLEDVYTTVRMENAAPQGKKPTVRNVEKLIAWYKGEYLGRFLRNAEKIVQKFVRLVKRGAKSSLARVMREMYGDSFTLNFDSKEVEETIRLIIRRNVGLIQNTTLQTLNNVENIVYDGMTTGQRWETIAKDLKTQTHIAKDRIKRIARDQTAKANAAFNEQAQAAAGVKFFMWSTAHDERVSTGKGGHKQLDGKIYKWGDSEHYPVIDAYGHRGLPAERPNCRCIARSILVAPDYEAKRLSDGSYEIIKGRI